MKKQANKKYKASIKVLGRIYKAEGKTLEEAISGLKPPVGKGVSVLTVSKGKQQKSKILPALVTFRLFNPSRLTKEIALKQMTIFFYRLQFILT